MFCQNCGKEIPENAHFCRYCGAPQEPCENIPDSPPPTNSEINPSEASVPSSPPAEEKPQSNDSMGCFFKLLAFTLISCIVIFLLIAVADCAASQSCSSKSPKSSSYTPKLFSRNAKNSDVQMEFSHPSLTSVCVTIRPYQDIDNLKITIKYFDSQGNTITSEQKTIGNVKEGVEYNTYLNILEFPASTDEYSVGVSGGTVSYFQ